MSIIVRLPPALLELFGGGSPERLYCKGADSVLLDLLQPGTPGSSTDMTYRKELVGQLNDWADVALRTLVWGKHELPDFATWHAAYTEACQSPEEVTKWKMGKPNKKSDLEDQVECNLTLQGATAIEDQLQDGVPEVLADLRSAGIKVWMLTGDKVGTAKNIATACNILPITADVLEITSDTYDALGEIKTAELLELQSRLSKEPAKEAALVEKLDAKYPTLKEIRAALRARAEFLRAAADGEERCLVLDEKAIEYCTILCSDALRDVGDGSHSVVACRARKDQKAQMLNLIKDGVPGSCCLGIGDGANDVAMIKVSYGLALIRRRHTPVGRPDAVPTPPPTPRLPPLPSS